MREETRAKFERELMKSRIRKGLIGVGVAAAIIGLMLFVYSRNSGPDEMVSEKTVPATVKFWYQAPVRQSQGQELISVTATLDSGKDVQAGSMAHHTAKSGDRIELTERHYKSGRTTYVWK